MLTFTGIIDFTLPVSPVPVIVNVYVPFCVIFITYKPFLFSTVPLSQVTDVIVPFSKLALKLIYNSVPSAWLSGTSVPVPSALATILASVICGFDPANSTFPFASTVKLFPSTFAVTGNVSPSTVPP